MTSNQHSSTQTVLVLTSLALGGTVFASNDVVCAQVVPDTTLGHENSRLSAMDARTQQIEGGAIRGSSLFHSFQQFGVPEGSGVYFSNPERIENIFSRVTGNTPSNINGTLGVLGNANLFLLNPNGILFGPNARLDIQGSFVASTANRLILPDGSQFSATNPEAPPLLEVNVQAPIGLQFEGEQPGLIVNAGDLAVQPGQNLALIGGTVVNTGHLQASGGEIAIVAVEGAGVEGNPVVQLSQEGRFLGQRVEPRRVEAALTSASAISLPEVIMERQDLGLTVNGEGQVTLQESGTPIPTEAGDAIIAGTLDASNLSAGHTGGTVQVSGSRVALLNNAQINVAGNIAGGTALIGGNYQGQGNLPNADQTFVDRGVVINADAMTAGNGGEVVVWADETTQFYGSATARGGSQSGDGGLIEISGAENLTFDGIADVGAFVGTPGTVLFDPRNITIVAGVGSDNNQLADGSIFFGDGGTSTDFQIGANALRSITGNIMLQASRDINIDINRNRDRNTSLDLSGMAGTTIDFSAGGNVNGVVNGVRQNITASGRNISIEGSSITLGAINTSTTSNINAGNITLRATGETGDISTDYLQANSVVTGNGTAGNGGNITLTTTGRGNIATRETADISTNYLEANSVVMGNGTAGNGGAVTINSSGDVNVLLTSLPPSRSGSISARSIVHRDGVAGNGGAITINSYGHITVNNPFLENSEEAGEAGEAGISSDSQVGGNNIFVTGIAGNGGAISLTSQTGDITIGTSGTRDNLSSWSRVFGDGRARDAGAITLNSQGSISTRAVLAFSAVTGRDQEGNSMINDAGNGGMIRLNASQDITTAFLSSASSVGLIPAFADGSFRLSNGDAENAGNISVTSKSGNIDIRGLAAFSLVTGSGNAGNGGDVTLTSSTGGISVTPNDGGGLSTFSRVDGEGRVSSGGDVTLSAVNDVITNIIRTSSEGISYPGSSSGNIRLTSSKGAITTGSLLASSDVNRGNITLDAYDDITIETRTDTTGNSPRSRNFSIINTSGGGDGGNISITSEMGTIRNQISVSNANNISGNGGLLISSDGIGDGNGGDIRLEAQSLSLNNTDVTTTVLGSGTPGNIFIDVSNAFALNSSRLFTSLERDAMGNSGGSIHISARSLSLNCSSSIDTATFSQGNAGNVTVNVDDFISLNNGSTIFSITADLGNAGNVDLIAGGNVSLNNRSNISTAVNEGATGDGGNILIRANSLSLQEGSQLQALTQGSGTAGDISVRAFESVTIDGTGSTETVPNSSTHIREIEFPESVSENTDDPDVEFSTRVPYVSINRRDELEMHDRYYFEVTEPGTRAIFDIDNVLGSVDTIIQVFDEQQGELARNNDALVSLGSGGSLSISPNNPLSRDSYLRFVFTGPGLYSVQVGASVPNDVEIAPIPTGANYELQVSLEAPNVTSIDRNGRVPSGLFAQSQSDGIAGNIEINTNRLSLENGAQISSENISSSQGGNVELNQLNLLEIDNGLISASTRSGRAGDLTVNTQRLTVANGGAIAASTRTGRAGNVTINSNESVEIRGNGSRIAAEAAQAHRGIRVPENQRIAGNLTINTTHLAVEDGATVTVSSPSGKAGNLRVNAELIYLDNGSLTSVTGRGDGGNIILRNVDHWLWMQNDSEISAQALSNANGGNVTINANGGFVIAYPYGNGDPDGGNDIQANALEGPGGRVEITAQDIIGLEERNRDTPFSDINVSSRFSRDGVFVNNTPGIDPNRGLTPLPDEPDSPEISNACQVGGEQENAEFYNVGRGGTPARPDEPLNANTITQDWIALEPLGDNNVAEAENSSASTNAQTPTLRSQSISSCQSL